MSPREGLALRLRQAFLDYGYEQLTMSGLAQVCGLTRRALYHHFSNKEEAFRFVLRHDGDGAILAGMAAGRQLLEQGGGALDILTEIMDVRYAENRRKLSVSPHALEINDKAFRLARDIMVEAATSFQDQLAELITEMAAKKLLHLRGETTPDSLAQMLCDGARGTNQTLPPIPVSELPARYRLILGAILYGAADPPA
jgi:AcrR family transcriptional regulator